MTPQTYLLRIEDTAITTGVSISHPNTQTHKHTNTHTHTHTHTNTHVYMVSEIFTGNLKEFSVSAN